MSENKDESVIDIGEYVEYRVNQFESLEGRLLWTFEALMLIMGLLGILQGRGVDKSFTIPLTGGLGFFLFFSWHFNYVRLSKDYLIIKNKVFFTREIIHEYSSVKEIELCYTSFGKFNNRVLRITTKDFKSTTYSCNLFNRKTFFNLKEALMGYGIIVKDRMFLTEKDFKTFMHQ